MFKINKYFTFFEFIRYISLVCILTIFTIFNVNAQVDLKLQSDTLTKINKKLKPFRNATESPISLDFPSFDEDIRDLQLLNKISSKNSFTIRPYYTSRNESYDQILYNIDSNFNYYKNIVYKKHFIFSLLPLSTTLKYNSDHPYGFNDGPLNSSKGFQTLTSTGFYTKFSILSLQLAPQFVKVNSYAYETRSDEYINWGYKAPSYSKLYPGNSFLKLDLGKLSIGLSSQSLWYGPGVISSLLMSNNAPGFPHFSLATNRPLKTFIGNFQFELLGGYLTRDTSQGSEVKYLKKLPEVNPYFNYVTQNELDLRYINSFAFSYNPSFLPNIFVGFSRFFINYNRESVKDDFMNTYIPVIAGFYKKDYEDKINRDQYISFNTRWIFPKDNAEAYLEFAYNDAFLNARDFILDNGHASSYLFGVKKLFPNENTKNKYFSILFEAERLGQTPSYIHRDGGHLYMHGQILEGFTNDNQIMGSGIIIGSNMQTFKFSFNNSLNKNEFIFRHISVDPSATPLSGNGINIGLNTIRWTDFGLGYISRLKYNNFLLTSHIEAVSSKNYLWVDRNQKFNLSLMMNLAYLW
jgi:hypothetical protein